MIIERYKKRRCVRFMEEYKKRFIAEYYALEEKLIKLRDLLAKAHENQLDFNLTCPVVLLKYQHDAMEDYLKFLIMRSFIEEISLDYSDRIKDVYYSAIKDNVIGNYE